MISEWKEHYVNGPYIQSLQIIQLCPQAIICLVDYLIHVNPPWSSGRLPEMNPKISSKTYLYSIHFWKTSLKWKENLPDGFS